MPRLGPLAVAIVLSLTANAPVVAQTAQRVPAPNSVLVDPSALDALNRGPAQTPQRQYAAPAQNPTSPLPPPGPGELEKLQAQINAAMRQGAPVQPQRASAPAAAKPVPAKPAKQAKTNSATNGKKQPPAKPAPTTAAVSKPAQPQPAPQPTPVAAPTVQPQTEQASATTAAPVLPPLPAPVQPPSFTPPPAPTPAQATPAAVAPNQAAPTKLTSATPAPAAPMAKPTPPMPSSQAPSSQAPSGQMANRPPPSEPAPPFVPSGKSAARVLFAQNSSELPEGAKPPLKALADQMNRDGDMRVQLVAYSGPRDDTQSQARRLSLFRALAVRSYLIEQGIRSTRMDVRALGNKYDQEPADRVDVVVADR